VIGSPSVRTGLTGDIYLTLEQPVPVADTDAARIKVLIMPLTIWLWIGGGLMLAGTALAAFPGQRRRPTEPVSAPVGASTAEDAAVPPELVGARDG
jgi:cytochrome c-type biogenesis protein CcmF